MSKTTVIVTVVAILIAFFLSPFRATDVSELLPVQTLCLTKEDGLCCLTTESGLMGRGLDPVGAIVDLQRTAPGVVVLSTTRTLVADDGAAEFLKPLLFLEELRPGTELYRSVEPIDPRDAADYLSRHGVETTVSRAQAAYLAGEEYPLPSLVGGEGRYHIIEPEGA